MLYLIFAGLFACLTVVSVALCFKESMQRFHDAITALRLFSAVEGVIAALAAYLFFHPPAWEPPGLSLTLLTVLFLFCAAIIVAAIQGAKPPKAT